MSIHDHFKRTEPRTATAMATACKPRQFTLGEVKFETPEQTLGEKAARRLARSFRKLSVERPHTAWRSTADLLLVADPCDFTDRVMYPPLIDYVEPYPTEAENEYWRLDQ